MTYKRTRRSKYAIAAAIIETALKPVRITDIVYDARLNFNITREYLSHLVENDLIRFDSNTKTYEASEQGVEYLDAFRHALKLYGE